MSKITLDITQETKMLVWITEYNKGIVKGLGRDIMYEIYRFFRQDRDGNVCKCLDPDTHKKVVNFINGWDWSEEIRKTAKFQELKPDLAIFEEVEFETDNNQPVSVNLDKVMKKIKKKNG
jgi:hypothetical protein